MFPAASSTVATTSGFGNNQMLVADVASGEIRRFLTGPKACEITGISATPDARSLFINVQHPGEAAGGRSSPVGAAGRIRMAGQPVSPV
jgi:secreted PhoX family phosphatase